MKTQVYQTAMTMVLLMGMALSAGCASLGRSDPKEAPVTLSEKLAGVEALEYLDRTLATVKSPRIIVPTQFLKALVHNNKRREDKCQALMEQLDEIKSVDLEEVSPVR